MTVSCILLESLDPYFNLATEEHLLKKYDEDIFMIWRSESSIVVGKHQNALAEINHQYVRENNIHVARRLSGGGTVFHDPGNVNFTFIKRVEKMEEVNFKIFTQPIVDVLKKLDLDAYTTGRNDLLIDGKKISGNAEHIHKKRVLHHGTLLFDSHLDKLRNALKVDLSRFEHKAVQSNRSEVGNISEYLKRQMSVEEFARFIFENIAKEYSDFNVLELTDEDIFEINKLKEEKYCQWEWIYGYSPKYKYHNTLKTSKGKVQFTFQIVKGKIVDSVWDGDLPESLTEQLSQKLLSQNHDIEVLKPLIKSLEKELSIEGVVVSDLLAVMA